MIVTLIDGFLIYLLQLLLFFFSDTVSNLISLVP